jgi:glycosyltransferase involved in cell wall biosynthesis
MQSSLTKQSQLPLSVIIHTKNSAATLAQALKSVAALNAEVIVMDMNSTDDTLSIAKKYQARILHSDKDYGYVEPARNQAIAAAKQAWILILDADEELPEAAATHIINLLHLSKAEQPADAYWLPRRNIVWTHPMEKTGWWPDFQLRLFKKGTVTWSNKIHSLPKITGQVSYWPAESSLAITHHNYQTIEQFIDRLNRYTTQEAGGRAEQKDFSPAQLLKAFREEWFSRLFANSGIDEGMHGVALSQLQAMYQVVVVLKNWQAAGFPNTHQTEQETQQVLAELRRFNSELRYWTAYWHLKKVTGVAQWYWRLRRKLRW